LISRQFISLPLALRHPALIGINEVYERSASAVKNIGSTQEARATLHKLLELMLDAEAGLRGYLLSGDERYLAYNDAVADINQTLDQLRQYYQEHHSDLSALIVLSRQCHANAEMDLSLKLRKQGNEAAWKFVMLTDVGKEHMDAIREQSGA
jgi:CHASE3 domain sensor protein